LFLGTHFDNTEDRRRKGRKNWNPETRVKGEQSPHAKLTADKVREIRQRVANGETRTALAKEMEMSLSAIAFIVRRERWSHIT
jgi:hypothetical protein